MVRCLRGRKEWFAKPSYLEMSTQGSNPCLTARIGVSGSLPVAPPSVLAAIVFTMLSLVRGNRRWTHHRTKYPSRRGGSHWLGPYQLRLTDCQFYAGWSSGQLAWLITKRSAVRIRSPQPNKCRIIW